MNEIEKLFQFNSNTFTIFVVEQRFVVGKGHDFFNRYINTPNFFDSEEKTKRFYTRILNTIGKTITPISDIISNILSGNYASSITEIVSSLFKIFSATEHQAAGPDIIDPIIIQEGKITKKTLSKIVNIHKESILRPSIIILLKDNDFERAKNLLSECPDGINVKMIRNSGEEIIYKVVNCGADDISSFISSFSEQCYSTCSNTKREILLNNEWNQNEVVSKFSPILFQFRSKMLLDQKEEISRDLSNTISEISTFKTTSSNDQYIAKNIECAARLYRIFCDDKGGQDIIVANELSKSLNNEILNAQIYKCADFLPNCSLDEKMSLYEEGYKIFKRNNMDDQAIYCRNNMLIEQFYSDNVYPNEFNDLLSEATSNVPGMVGLTHIFNNVGVAYLYSGQSDIAIDIFSKGIDHAVYQNRMLQKLALESNKMIAESYSFAVIDEKRIRFFFRQLFDSMGINKLPFLTADFALNVLSVSLRQNINLAKEVLNDFPIVKLVNNSFNNNLCVSERILMLQFLASKYPSIKLIELCNIPNINIEACGKRKDFILKYGFNPFEFSTWM